MKVYGVVDAYIHVFYTPVGGWSASIFGPITPGENFTYA
jgi:hypothetical protein